MKFHRRSIRLPKYDYSQSGAYFITICTHQREWLFGEILNKKMLLNEFGNIARNVWLKTPKIRPNINLGEFIIMPNHIHGIIWIKDELSEGVWDGERKGKGVWDEEGEVDRKGVWDREREGKGVWDEEGEVDRKGVWDREREGKGVWDEEGEVDRKGVWDREREGKGVWDEEGEVDRKGVWDREREGKGVWDEEGEVDRKGVWDREREGKGVWDEEGEVDRKGVWDREREGKGVWDEEGEVDRKGVWDEEGEVDRKGVLQYAPTTIPTTAPTIPIPLTFRSPSKTIGAIIRGYKASVTKQINIIRKLPGFAVWQRNYYEHIIRNEEDLNNITQYIKSNPKNWNKDDLYKL